MLHVNMNRVLWIENLLEMATYDKVIFRFSWLKRNLGFESHLGVGSVL